MIVDFKIHFVAFLDILGFSDMVCADDPVEREDYLRRLYKCHNQAVGIFSKDPYCSVTQFSDSIVLARPFHRKSFSLFIDMISEYQRLLFCEQLLCRGGIAVDHHFSNRSFTFSAGLVSAYRVESTEARNPRIVISSDVAQLIYPDPQVEKEHLIEENDGAIFIDYLGSCHDSRRSDLIISGQRIVQYLLINSSSSVREKGLWLASYMDAVLGTKLSTPQFRGRSTLD